MQIDTSLFSDAAAQAVVHWVADAAAKSKNYKIKGYTVTFKAHKSYGLIGVGGTLLALAALLFVPDRIAAYILGGIFGILGVLIDLYGFVMSLSMTPYKITYRGPFGRKKELLWQHVKGFGIANEHGDILVDGPAGRIRIFGYLAGYTDIKKLLRSRFPFEAAATPADEDDHGVVFRPRRTIGIILLGATLALLVELTVVALGILPSPLRPFIVILTAATGLLGLVAVLDFFLTRLYLDGAGLASRRLFGQKSLRWSNIESVSLSMDPYRREAIRLSGAGQHIRIDASYKDYAFLRDMVLERCPEPALPNRPGM